MPKPRVSLMETWQFLLSWSFLSVLQRTVPPVHEFLLLVTFTNVSNPIKESHSGTVLLWFHSDILIESMLLLQQSVLPLLVLHSVTEAASERLEDIIFPLCIFCNAEM